MKKFLHAIYCHTCRQVRDTRTNQVELATYYKIFGFVIKTTYKAI